MVVVERKRLIIIVALAALLLVVFFYPKHCGPEVGVPEMITSCSCLGIMDSNAYDFCYVQHCYGVWYGCSTSWM